jgi:hypothetical protein
MSNVTSLSSGELLSLYAGVLVELRRRGIVRTANNPVADLGERLFCDAMGWEREGHQSTNYDAMTADGARVQIKARRLTRERPAMRSGTIYDKDGFDLLAIVMFDPEFRVDRAVIVPREIALRHLRWSARQKGWFIGLSRSFWNEQALMDVTDRLIRESQALLLRSD